MPVPTKPQTESANNRSWTDIQTGKRATRTIQTAAPPYGPEPRSRPKKTNDLLLFTHGSKMAASRRTLGDKDRTR